MNSQKLKQLRSRPKIGGENVEKNVKLLDSDAPKSGGCGKRSGGRGPGSGDAVNRVPAGF
jgi:hypothetical protein